MSLWKKAVNILLPVVCVCVGGCVEQAPPAQPALHVQRLNYMKGKGGEERRQEVEAWVN